MPAQHAHDCRSCMYLGQLANYDLYLCRRLPSVVARYGGKERETLIGSVAYTTDPILIEAKRRAHEAGLL